MGEYLKTIVSSVLAVGLISTLLPRDSFSKYANLLSGIIVMAVIVSPIAPFNDDDFIYEKLDVKSLELDTKSYLMEEYEKELSENLTNMLKEKTDIDFSIVVRAKKSENTIEIEEIEIAPYASSYISLICDYLGIDEGRISAK